MTRHRLATRRGLFAVVLLAVVAAGSAIAPAQAMAPTPVFAPYLNYDVGEGRSVAIGDFTGDGRNDVALSTGPVYPASVASVHVFSQGPDGWLNHIDVVESPSRYPGRLGLAAGDVDGDGRTDAVLANEFGLDVLLQRAGVLTHDHLITLDGAASVKVADVDGDGIADLVATAGAGVVFIRGLGAGAFAPAVVVSTQQQAEVDLGDVTGDGRRDIVSCNGAVALVFAQLPGGAFATRTQHSGDVVCASVAVGDVTGDGRADVSMVGVGGTPSVGRLDVFAQQADGIIPETATTTYPTELSPGSVKTGDMNGDGRLDLVVVHQNQLWVGVHAQAPDHSLDPERLYRIPASSNMPQELAIGDANGDQRPDILIAGRGLAMLWGQPAAPSTTTSTLKLATTAVTSPPIGAPRPLFSAPQNYDLRAAGDSVAAGDFNGDGRTDLALSTTNDRGDASVMNKLFLFYQAADGSLPRAVSFDTDGYSWGMGETTVAAGDLDGDGATDLVRRGSAGIDVFLQRSGTFADRKFLEMPRVYRMDLGDLDGDGKADMVTTGPGIRVYRSLGGGTFAPPETVLINEYRDQLAIGDVTGDGRPDLVSVSGQAVEVFRQLPDGSFGAAERTTAAGDAYRLVAMTLGDLNADGRLDIAATYAASGQVVGVQILFQGLGGTLSLGPDVDAYAAGPLRTGDIDGDGRNDLVLWYGVSAGVRLQQVGGQLGAEQMYPISGSTATPPTGVVLADFSGDRRLDIATADAGQGLDVLRNASAGVPPQAPTSVAGTFHPLSPQRILDTRTGLGAPAARLGPGGTVSLQVTGAGGVPASGVSAVVMNVTVTEPTAGGFLTVSPAGEPRPVASNLNYVAGQTVPNLVVVKVGAGGKVDLYNSSGSAHVIADVAGWYGPDGGTPGGRYNAVTPARILDTRSGSKLGAGGTLRVPVTGQGGVPASGVSAVVLNVTATEPTANSYLTAWPAGEARPVASNLNYGAGQTVPNLVVVKVGAGGNVDLFNNAGATHVVADVAGWFGDAGAAGGLFTPVSPARLLDTRTGGGALGPAGTVGLQATGRGGVPASGVSAVVLNVTVTEPTALSFLTAWPAGAARPLASNLNYATGQTVPNLVVVKVGAGGVVNLFNYAGTTHVVADVAGWFG